MKFSNDPTIFAAGPETPFKSINLCLIFRFFIDICSFENLSYEQRYVFILTYEACIKEAIEASMARSMYCSYKSKK